MKVKKKYNQIEGQHQRTLGGLLNGSFKNRLNPNLVFWTYSGSGEYKTIKTASLQKRKGLQKGDFDYRFEIKDGDLLRIVYLETKSGSGSLTKDQKRFKENHENISNCKCYLSNDIEESLNILKQEKVLLI